MRKQPRRIFLTRGLCQAHYDDHDCATSAAPEPEPVLMPDGAAAPEPAERVCGECRDLRPAAYDYSEPWRCGLARNMRGRHLMPIATKKATACSDFKPKEAPTASTPTDAACPGIAGEYSAPAPGGGETGAASPGETQTRRAAPGEALPITPDEAREATETLWVRSNSHGAQDKARRKVLRYIDQTDSEKGEG